MRADSTFVDRLSTKYFKSNQTNKRTKENEVNN